VGREERASNFSYGYPMVIFLHTSFPQVNFKKNGWRIALKQTKLLHNHKRFVRVFWGMTVGEVLIIKERGTKNRYYMYISITTEAS